MKYLFSIFVIVAMLCSGCSQPNTNKEDIAPVIDIKEKCTVYQYHRNNLSENEQKIYDTIYQGVLSLQTEIYLSCDEQTLSDILLMVCNDHPELFWLNTKYEYSVTDEDTIFYPNYTYTAEEIKGKQNDVNTVTQKIIEQVQDLSSDYEKVLFLYDWIINETDYIDGTENNQNMLSTLLDHQAVCAGYSEALKYLLDQLSIPNGIILVKAKDNTEEFHVINLVQMEQEWYYLDPTFGDIKVEEDFDTYRYTYFAMTSDEIEKIYIPQQEYTQTQAYKNNYFYKNNMYLDVYDEQTLTTLLLNAIQNDEPCIAIKCRDSSGYEAIKQVIESNQIFDLFHLISYYPQGIRYYMVDETYCFFLSYK